MSSESIGYRGKSILYSSKTTSIWGKEDNKCQGRGKQLQLEQAWHRSKLPLFRQKRDLKPQIKLFMKWFTKMNKPVPPRQTMSDNSPILPMEPIRFTRKVRQQKKVNFHGICHRKEMAWTLLEIRGIYRLQMALNMLLQIDLNTLCYGTDDIFPLPVPYLKDTSGEPTIDY